MKYSIITPVYNAEKYLRDCIESVIAQTYSDWELLLIDDGSTDNSPTICDEYASKDSRIRTFHILNSGAYKARLYANEYIEGDYAVGLDSDDMYVPECLERIECARKKSNADMIVFGRMDLYCDTDEKKSIELDYELEKIYTKEEFLEKALIFTDHALWNKAIKSDVYRNAEYIHEEHRLSVSLDYIQELPLLCGIETGYVISENLYIYRLREDSISHNIKLSHFMDNDWINIRIREYLVARNMYTESIRYALEYSYLAVIMPRLFKIKWKISAKDRKMLKSCGFLNSMTNNINDLISRKSERALIKYIKCGLWGPKGFFYKMFIKCYIGPQNRRERKC